MATVGSLIGPFVGAILFTSVDGNKVFWTWGPIGFLFMFFGLLFLFAFRKFNDSTLIAESNYSKLDDSEDWNTQEELNSMELSGVKVKHFEDDDPVPKSYFLGDRKKRNTHDVRAYNSNNSVDILRHSGRRSH